MAKTCSTTTALTTSADSWMPTTVSTGSAALRSTVSRTTCGMLAPVARAVRT
eukprot:TRINITY_DN4526_c0_g1_i1.p4 TRINITY_DN4526_c0_g1~~TRINITY_DN4526_c0_g1_i1.p4  ORF type:complete len:52 (+),score=1.19 TRINITY_DN4526_c0_g1_i1:187-342(+)